MQRARRPLLRLPTRISSTRRMNPLLLLAWSCLLVQATAFHVQPAPSSYKTRLCATLDPSSADETSVTVIGRGYISLLAAKLAALRGYQTVNFVCPPGVSSLRILLSLGRYLIYNLTVSSHNVFFAATLSLLYNHLGRGDGQVTSGRRSIHVHSAQSQIGAGRRHRRAGGGGGRHVRPDHRRGRHIDARCRRC